MIRSYITIALRNIKRNWSYAFLNIFGLTLGIASCLVIFLIVRNELNYDNYKKADRIYRVTLNAIDFNSNVSLAIVPTIRVDFPELEQVTQVMYNNDVMVKVNNTRFRDKDFAFVDSSFPKIFDLKWIKGDPKTSLSEPNAIVLNETLAKKYFGDKDPMGQVINVENQLNVKVTGVIKDLPGNRSVPLQMLCSLETIKSRLNLREFWNIGGGFFTFILLPPNYPISKVQSKIPAFLKKNWGLNPKEVRLPLQPLNAIHFDQRYINNVITPTSKATYYGLFGVALLIIITACINFINLATAQAIKRSKEVGVRKVLGANRRQLIKQFLGETTIMVLFAVILGVFIAFLFLSNAAVWLNINIDAGQLSQPIVVLWIVCLTIAVILIAGLYPSFVQSAFQPVDSLKRQSAKSVHGFSLRKGLVVAQFAISQVLIVGTLIVARQMNYFENQDLGFNKEAIVSFYVPDMKKNAALQHYMANDPGVAQFTFSSGAPTYNNNFANLSAPQFGITKDDVTEVKFVDENFIDMFGLKMLAGQKITKQDPKDTTQSFVVNETLIQKMGITDPAKAIGQRININGRPSTIIGVIRDFQSESKHKKRRACALQYQPDRFFMTSIKIQPSAINKTIQHLNRWWSTLYPDNLLNYKFLDDNIASFYTQEQKVYTAFQLFSSIAIIIGCLGLYGLIAFAASQRTKEIGIRKVLGAPIMNIIGLFSKEFILLITIAFIIAAPLGYYMMHNWLENYAYHISIGPDTFIVAVITSILIAAATIAYQTIKAATANPVKSLRSE